MSQSRQKSTKSSSFPNVDSFYKTSGQNVLKQLQRKIVKKSSGAQSTQAKSTSRSQSPPAPSSPTLISKKQKVNHSQPTTCDTIRKDPNGLYAVILPNFTDHKKKNLNQPILIIVDKKDVENCGITNHESIVQSAGNQFITKLNYMRISFKFIALAGEL